MYIMLLHRSAMRLRTYVVKCMYIHVHTSLRCMTLYVHVCTYMLLHTCYYIHVTTYICNVITDICSHMYLHTLSERTPPPRGGFLFTIFPHQELCVRGPPSKDLYQVLRGGSSSTRFLMREHSK